VVEEGVEELGRGADRRSRASALIASPRPRSASTGG